MSTSTKKTGILTLEQELDIGARERFEILMDKSLDFRDETSFPNWISEELSKKGHYNEAVREFLIKNSLICHEVGTGNPASDRICRVVYSDSYFGWGPIDDWISRGLGGKSLFNRLPAVSNMLVKILKREASNNFRIKDLGAGSGSYAFKTLGMLRTMGFPINKISWECVDISSDALNFGKNRAEEDNFSSSVSFKNLNFMSSQSYPEEKERADLLILVGVLCGMTKEDSIKCLKKIRPHGKLKAEIIAATLLVQSYKEDPLAYQVLAKLGWYLRPKTMEEIKTVFDRAGYEITSINSERFDSNGNEILGEYAIVRAKSR